MAGKTRLAHIPLDQIRVGEIALRGVEPDSQSFIELADSVKAEGVITAIAVREKTDEQTKATFYELIDGAQRYAAAKLAELPDIPAQILDRDDQEVMIAQIIANAKRVETKPMDFMNQVMKIMVANPTMTMSELSDVLHCSPSWLESILKLKGLHESIKPLVNDGHIPLSNAFALAKLQPPEEQLPYVNDAQTKPAAEFTGPVLERSKALRAAAREGRAVGEAQYVATPRFRKINEVTEQLQNPTVAAAVVRKYSNEVENNGIKDAQSASIGFQLGLQWVARVDLESQAVGKAEFEAKKKAAAEDKIRAEAAKTKKRQEEAAKRSEEAKKKAEAAAEAAAKLPPQPETAGATAGA